MHGFDNVESTIELAGDYESQPLLVAPLFDKRHPGNAPVIGI